MIAVVSWAGLRAAWLPRNSVGRGGAWLVVAATTSATTAVSWDIGRGGRPREKGNLLLQQRHSWESGAIRNRGFAFLHRDGLLPRLRSATTSDARFRLCGIAEWRDLLSDYPGTSSDNLRNLGSTGSSSADKPGGGLCREVCILPFPYREVLLQGETKQLRLYEERFVHLFEHCQQHHCGVVAMGMIASSLGIVQTVPLAEIEAYNRVAGFGIFVTIRVVGRAKLLDVIQQEPYIKAVCVELTDTLPPNLEL